MVAKSPADSMFVRLTTTWKTVGHAFGTWMAPVGPLFMFGILRTSVFFGMALDNIFIGKLRSTKVNRPIVIVGNPRTGTTFLQRFLDEQGVGSGLRLYQMLYPSIILQKIIRPFLPFLEKISPARHHSTAAHETNLVSVETDDVAILFRYFDGFFLYGFFLAWAEQDYRSWVEPAVRDTSKRDFDWLEKLWRRNAVTTGRPRAVAKLFSLGLRAPQFLERFPDAKILYMARDPLEVIPSGMSLVTGVLDKWFGFWKLPEEKRRRYLDRLYVAFVELLRGFHTDYSTGKIDNKRVFIVRFDRMMKDFNGLMKDLMKFIDVVPDEKMLAEIDKIDAKQRKFKSAHAYDLAKFNLTEEKIRKDCDFFYRDFLGGEQKAG